MTFPVYLGSFIGIYHATRFGFPYQFRMLLAALSTGLQPACRKNSRNHRFART
jgi:hypothetical protein